MRIAIEHAGAERGLLILLWGDEPQIEAEAKTGHGGVKVTVRQAAVTPFDLPKSTFQYVIRTRERVVLDDALVADLYWVDEYVLAKRVRSVLCLPIVKQTKLIGALYLENNLTPRAFTSDRVALLELLASQAAISLENASLYSDLQRSYSDLHRGEAFLAEGQSISNTGSFGWSVLSGEIYWSEETYNIFQHDRAVKPTLELVLQRIHPDDGDRVRQALDQATNEKTDFDIERRLLMPDGSVKHVHVLARALKASSRNLEYVGAVSGHLAGPVRLTRDASSAISGAGLINWIACLITACRVQKRVQSMKTPIPARHPPIAVTRHCSALSWSAVRRNESRYRLCISSITFAYDVPVSVTKCIGSSIFTSWFLSASADCLNKFRPEKAEGMIPARSSGYRSL